MSGDEWWMSSGTLSNSSLTDFEVLSRPSDDDAYDDEILRDFDDTISILSSLSSDGSDNENSILGYTLDNVQAMLRCTDNDSSGRPGHDGDNTDKSPPMGESVTTTTNDSVTNEQPNKQLFKYSIFGNNHITGACYFSDSLISKVYHASEVVSDDVLTVSDNDDDDDPGLLTDSSISTDQCSTSTDHNDNEWNSTDNNIAKSTINENIKSIDNDKEKSNNSPLSLLDDGDIALLGLGKTNDENHAFFRILAKPLLKKNRSRNIWCYELNNSTIERQLVGVIRGFMADFFSSRPSSMDLQLWNKRKQMPQDLPIAAYIYYAHGDSWTWNVSHYSLLKRLNIPAFPITEDSVDAIKCPSILASPRGPFKIKSSSIFLSRPTVRPLTARQMESFEQSEYVNDFCNLLRLSKQKPRVPIYPVPIGVIQQEAVEAFNSQSNLRKLYRKWTGFSLPDMVALLAIFITLLLQYYSNQYGGLSPTGVQEYSRASSLEQPSFTQETWRNSITTTSSVAVYTPSESLSTQTGVVSRLPITPYQWKALLGSNSFYSLKDVSELESNSITESKELISNNSWNMTSDGFTTALSVIQDTGKTALIILDESITLLVAFYQNLVYPTLHQYGKTLLLTGQEIIRKVEFGELMSSSNDESIEDSKPSSRNTGRSGTVTLTERQDFRKKWHNFCSMISDKMATKTDETTDEDGQPLLNKTDNVQLKALKRSSYVARKIWDLAQNRSIQAYLTVSDNYCNLMNSEQMKKAKSNAQSTLNHISKDTSEKLTEFVRSSSSILSDTMDNSLSAYAILIQQGRRNLIRGALWSRKMMNDMPSKYEELAETSRGYMNRLQQYSKGAADYLGDKTRESRNKLRDKAEQYKQSSSMLWKKLTNDVSRGYQDLGQQTGPKVSSILRRLSAEQQHITSRAGSIRFHISKAAKTKMGKKLPMSKRRWGFRTAKPTKYNKFTSIWSRWR